MRASLQRKKVASIWTVQKDKRVKKKKKTTEEDEWQQRKVAKRASAKKSLRQVAKDVQFDSEGHRALWMFPRACMCLDCFFLETFDDETIVKLFRQCLPLLKMQMSVINPAFAHLFWCVWGWGGRLHLALLNPSITQGSRINGMQRKAVSARRHAGRIPAAGARRAGGERSTEAGADQSIRHTLWMRGDRSVSAGY